MTGTTLQNYYIESLLGEGGMGRVYKATDTVLGRQVAIKSLNTALTIQPSFLERFKNEAKTLARLAHPNIAVLYNYLKEGNDYYMVMEYVEGENLDELTKRNKTLPCEVIIPLMVQALEGLEHAHKKGVLHRDIKPANLMLTPENMVKLMDFGIAKVSDSAKLTQTSRIIGTLEFLAPELIEGNEPSPASDIYAAGVTMYEMLTGKLPFAGKSDYMLMQEIVKEKPAAPVNFNTNTPAALSDIILKALEKKPGDRFESAAAFSKELQTAFPDFKKIPAGFVSRVIETKAVNASGQTMEHPAAPATMLYKESPATQLYTGNKEPKGFMHSFSKNKLIYIAAALLLVIGFTAFSFFSGGTEDNKLADNTRDTTSVIEEFSNDGITADNDVISNNANSDSINFILDKKKQEEQNTVTVQTEKTATENKKPVTKKPTQKTVEAVADNTSKTPGQKIEDTANNTSKKPAPEPGNDEDDDVADVALNQPIKLRGHGMPVMLALRENISKQTASEGQPVSFKVVEPAMLKGNVIIPSGSVINGTIKGLGSRRMSIIFNSVSANGRHMRLDRSEAGASMEKVFSGNTFRINLNGTLNP